MPSVKMPATEFPFPAEAASFSGFFHWDQAYSEALRRPRAALPPSWQKRVDCWRVLLQWWLLRRVEEHDRPIRAPFDSFVPRVQGGAEPVVRSVTWLKPNDHPRAIGVVSKVVLVRPLPDASVDDAVWNWTPDPATRAEVAGLLAALTSTVHAAVREQPSPAVRLLHSILTTQFPNAADTVPDNSGGHEGFAVVDFRTFRSHRIVLRRKGSAHPRYVPMCPACRRPLLPLDVELAPDQTDFVVECPTHGAVHLQLQNFLCAWYQVPQGRVNHPVQKALLAWKNRPPQWAPGAPALRLPPEVREREGGIEFLYDQADDASLVGRPGDQRIARIRVSTGIQCQALRLSDVCFERPLLGRVGQLRSGGTTILPLQPEYVGLWTEIGTPSQPRPGVVRLGLRGLPHAVELAFGQPVDATAVGVAVVPDPDIVPTGWRRFSLACSAGFVIAVDGSRGNEYLTFVLPQGTALSVVSVEKADDPRAGCTLALAESTVASGEVGIQMAVDFGTTSSIVYIRNLAMVGNPAPEPLIAEQLRRSRASRWLLKPDHSTQEVLDTLLPRAGESSADDALIPSELCRPHGRINWAHRRCCTGPHDIAAFIKSDATAGSHRETYLREVLALALCQVVGSLQGRPAGLNLDAVFTFPLTFTPPERDRYTQEIQRVLDLLKDDCGTLSARFRLLDESSAGVLSVGQPHATDWVLVADLGGGTLDLSMGAGNAYGEQPTGSLDWIGSLDVGGRYLLAGFPGLGTIDQQVDFQAAIRHEAQQAREAFRNARAGHALHRYMSAMFFFLATVAHARLARATLPGSTRVHLYLLGNGWHYWRLTADPRLSVDDWFVQHMERNRRRTELYLSKELKVEVLVSWANRPGTHTPDPKHAVALGAVSAATATHPRATSLPTGIGLRKANGESCEWLRPIGPTGTGCPFPLDAGVEFDFPELSHRLRTHHKQFVADVPADSFPAEDQSSFDQMLRLALIDPRNRAGVGPEVIGYFRGPLQLLFEKSWRPSLWPEEGTHA